MNKLHIDSKIYNYEFFELFFILQLDQKSGVELHERDSNFVKLLFCLQLYNTPLKVMMLTMAHFVV